MSHSVNLSNGKWQSVADLEKGVNELEENFTDMNKSFIRKVLFGLSGIMNSITREEPGIFRVVLKWFRLYLNVHTSINPDDTKLIKYFENFIPTIITYIIGCLQYKTKDIPNYHYELLNIFEQLLENVPTKVLAKIKNFDVGTIGYLWNPIDIVGDFNTQQKALKMLSILLKQFDDIRLNEELKHIKWINFNLFKDKLKTIIQETKFTQYLENASRELLNNFNMNLSKSVLVYSFYCKSLELGNRYKFYKPLNLHKFWIDINYTPKTLSYSGRFKLNSKSRCENLNVIVDVQTMKLENSILSIQYKHPGEFSKYSEIFTNLSQNVIKMHLSKDEEQRLEENSYIMEYFNKLNNLKNKNKTDGQGNRDAFDLLKRKTYTSEQDESIISNKENKTKDLIKTDNKSINLKSKIDSNVDHKYYKHILDSPPNQSFQNNQEKKSPESISSTILNASPKSSREITNKKIKQHPIRQLRNRKKFFFSFAEEDSEQDITIKKGQKKKAQTRKSRQSKARGKKVCKVTPTVDLTKFENTDEVKENEKVSLPKYSSPLISTQDCKKVLKNVADIYNIDDKTYAKPCQSYRQFKTDLVSNSNANTSSISIPAGKRFSRRTANTDDNNTLITKKRRKVINENTEANKENINPTNSNLNTTLNKVQSLQQNNKRIISPHIFESQHNDIITPNKVLRTQNTLVENPSKATIDLTFDEGNISNASFECEEVRGICEIYSTTHMKTPVQVALLGNEENKLSTPRPTSAMYVSDFNDSDMELTQIPLNSNQITKQSENAADRNCITEVVQQILQDFDCVSPTTNTKEQDFNEDCGNDLNDVETNNSIFLPKLFKPTELPIKRDIIVMHSRPIYLCQQNNLLTTPDKSDTISTNISNTKTSTKCQVTPTAVIMQQIQVSSKKSVILRNSKPSKFYMGNKAKKNLNTLYSKEQLLNLKKDQLMASKTNLETKVQIKSIDGNNNIVIAPKHHSLESISSLSLKHIKQSTTARNITTCNNNDYLQNLIDLNETSSSTETAIPKNTRMLCIKGVQTDNNEGNSKLSRDYKIYKPSESTFNELIKDDLHKIIQNHNKNIRHRMENAQRLYQSNTSKIYSKNICELLQSILQKTEKQKFEMEQFLANICQLVKEIQTQYETFVKRSKEYDINKEVINYILENFVNMENHNMKTRDNEDLIQQLNNENSELLDKLLELVSNHKTLQ